MKCASFSLVVLVTLLGLCLGSHAVASIYNYDPNLQTLPEAQGFTRLESTGSPAPDVSAGTLHQFRHPDGVGGTQGWFRDDVAVDFFASAPYVLDATLRVISSDYDPDVDPSAPEAQRSGYAINLVDAGLRNFTIGITDQGVYINTDGIGRPNNGVPLTPFADPQVFHDFRFVIDSGIGTLFIDGSLFGSSALPVGAVVPQVLANRLSFGDLFGIGSSQTELRSLQFAQIPEPSTISMGLLLLVVTAFGSARRRLIECYPFSGR